MLRTTSGDFVDDGIPTDGLSGLSARHSMQMRRSETFGRNSIASIRSRGDSQRLLHRDEEVGLRDLADDSESEEEMRVLPSPKPR